MTSRTLTQCLLAMALLLSFSVGAMAQQPEPTSPSDQKAGSVLFYNLYASSASNAVMENTRINITNTHAEEGILLHLFFVDGDSCSVADSYLCLSKSQTTSLLASDIDPGVTGYLLAVAVTPNGRPANFNYLIGDEYIKLASGHVGNLGAESIAVVNTPLHPFSTPTDAYLAFDGFYYEKLPNSLALSNIASADEGNNTLLILNRFSGVLNVTAYPLGRIFGVLFDELENGYSFNFSGGCQFRGVLSDNFPRTAPRFRQLIPSGQTGWMKLWTVDSYSGTMLGAAITMNKTSSARSFNGSHNLHKLSFTQGGCYVIPVFPGMCN